MFKTVWPFALSVFVCGPVLASSARPLYISSIENIDTIVSSGGLPNPDKLILVWKRDSFDNPDRMLETYDALRLLESWRTWILPSGRVMKVAAGRRVQIVFDNPLNESTEQRKALFLQWFMNRASRRWRSDDSKAELIDRLPTDLKFLAGYVELSLTMGVTNSFDDFPGHSPEFLRLLQNVTRASELGLRVIHNDGSGACKAIFVKPDDVG